MSVCVQFGIEHVSLRWILIAVIQSWTLQTGSLPERLEALRGFKSMKRHTLEMVAKSLTHQ